MRLRSHRLPPLLFVGSALILASASAPVRAQPRTLAQWVDSVERAERSGESWSAIVKDLASGETVFSHRADLRLIPASNRKIMVFALALESLGPDFTFKTELGLSGEFDPASGRLRGAVVLRSDGDPTFTARYLNGRNPDAILRGWADRLRASGVKRIEGDLILDASAFGADQNVFPQEVWEPHYRSAPYAHVPSAIAINQNLMQFTAIPQSANGGPARLDIYPSSEGLGVINETRIVSGRISGLEARFDEAGRNVVVSGRVGRDVGSHVVSAPLIDPLGYVRNILADAVRAEGIELTGRARVTTDSREGNALRITRSVSLNESPPLAELLRVMMRDSDNFLAEQIWRSTAFHAFGRGDRATARRLEQRWYSDRKAPWIEPGHDGSGLSRLNRVAASEIALTLETIHSRPYRPYLIDALPTSGRTGTLRRRTMGVAAGRIVAKTGTLSGASALSGFIRDKAGRERWVFAAIGNRENSPNGLLSTRQDELMKILVRTLDEGGWKPSDPASVKPPLKRYKPGTKVRVDGAGS